MSFNSFVNRVRHGKAETGKTGEERYHYSISFDRSDHLFYTGMASFLTLIILFTLGMRIWASISAAGILGLLAFVAALAALAGFVYCVYRIIGRQVE